MFITMAKYDQKCLLSTSWGRYNSLLPIKQHAVQSDQKRSSWAYTILNLVNKKMLDIYIHKSDEGLMAVLSFTQNYLSQFSHTMKLLVENKNHCL